MLLRIFIAISLYLIACLPNFAYAEDVTKQRAVFMQAKTALASGNYVEFSRLSEQLKNYVLYPYLRFADLEERLAQLTEQEVVKFTQQYADMPLATRLQDDWLESLAEQQQWSLFKKYYKPTNKVRLQCFYLQALLANGEEDLAFQTGAKLWLVGYTQPTACEKVFFTWQKAGKLSERSVWQRIELALAKKNYLLATQLSAWLPFSMQSQVGLWQQIHQQPELIFQNHLFVSFTYRIKKIWLDGIDQLAKKDPEKAAELWSTFQTPYVFTVNEQQEIIRMIAIGLARAAHPGAMDWLNKIDPMHTTVLVKEWRIRTALLNKNWQQVNHWINQLDLTEQQMSIWRYWRARALMALGNVAASKTLYQALAKQIDYYGLLASQQLRQVYRPAVTVAKTDNKMLVQLTKTPSIQRAQELYILNLLVDARREWQWEINKLNQTQLVAAIQLAAQWHWYDRMIVTAAKANLFNNITLRFPLAFRQQVLQAAKNTKVEPSWLFAIMRQESAFVADAKSSVGALGLMQLMPKTGEFLMKNLHLSSVNANLLNADTNIQVGSFYLKELSERFANNKTIATAAYNVGPTRIKKYAPLYDELGQDIWVEILPWQETRNYVKNVTLNQAIYQQELKGSAKVKAGLAELAKPNIAYSTSKK